MSNNHAYIRTKNDQTLNSIFETNNTRNESGYQKTRDLGIIKTQPNTMDYTVFPMKRMFLQFNAVNNFRAIMKQKVRNIKSLSVNKIVITGIVGGAGILTLRFRSSGRDDLKIRNISNLNYLSDEGLVLYHDGTGSIIEEYSDTNGQLLMAYKISTDMNDTEAQLVGTTNDNVVCAEINIWFTVHALNFH